MYPACAYIHPELCFWAWNGNKSMAHSKRSPDGKVERRRLIGSFFGQAAVDEVRATHANSNVGLDDIHDAFAALWTAQRIAEGTASVIPQPTPRDSEELRMGIWY
jgi:predicted RNase H-like nuclease